MQPCKRKLQDQEIIDGIRILNAQYPQKPPHFGPSRAWPTAVLWENFFQDICTRQAVHYRLELLVKEKKLQRIDEKHRCGLGKRVMQFYFLPDSIAMETSNAPLSPKELSPALRSAAAMLYTPAIEANLTPAPRPQATLSSVPKLVPTTASFPTKAPAPELRKRILLCDVCGGMLEVKAHTGLQFQDCVHCQTAYVTHNSDAFRLGPAIPIKVYVLTPDLVAK